MKFVPRSIFEVISSRLIRATSRSCWSWTFVICERRDLQRFFFDLAFSSFGRRWSRPEQTGQGAR